MHKILFLPQFLQQQRKYKGPVLLHTTTLQYRKHQMHVRQHKHMYG